MNTIKIERFLGVNSRGDPADIGISQFTELENLKPIDVKGTKLVKTFGFGVICDDDAVNPTAGYEVYNLVTHIESNLLHPTGYKYCLVTVNSSQLLKIYRYNDDTDIWELLTLLDTYYHKEAQNPIIQTHQAIRFLPGNVGEADGTHESKGLWYGHLERNFFYS